MAGDKTENWQLFTVHSTLAVKKYVIDFWYFRQISSVKYFLLSSKKYMQQKSSMRELNWKTDPNRRAKKLHLLLNGPIGRPSINKLVLKLQVYSHNYFI